MTDPLVPYLSGTRIAVSNALVGSKKAVQFGDGPINVSPAMYESMKHATPDELQTLLANIPVLHLPPMPSIYDTPMFTQPPPPEEFSAVASMKLWGLWK